MDPLSLIIGGITGLGTGVTQLMNTKEQQELLEKQKELEAIQSKQAAFEAEQQAKLLEAQRTQKEIDAESQKEKQKFYFKIAAIGGTIVLVGFVFWLLLKPNSK